MPTLEIAGKQVQVGDDFLKLSPDDQNATVDEIAHSIGAAPAQPADTSHRAQAVSGLRGVPVLGAYADKATAALNAAAQPLVGAPGMSEAPTFSERMADNERRIKAATDQYERENPVGSKIDKLVAGTAATLPVAGTSAGATILGLGGKTLAGQVARGAASNAAISALDAAARGEDPIKSAEAGGIVGAVTPVALRGVGAAVRGIKQLRTPEVTAPQRAESVAGVNVPLTESQTNGDAAQSAMEQVLRRGGRGERAQQVAQDFEDLQNQRLAQAHEAIQGDLNPGASVAAPAEAGQNVADELAATQQQRAAVMAAGANDAEAQRQGIRAAIGGGELTPFEAADALGNSIRARADAAREARTAAYEAARNVEGEFSPAAFTRIGQSIRTRLNRGDNPVRVTEQLTPNAAAALDDLQANVGQLRFENQAGLPQRIGPDGRPVAPPITGTTIDEARKRLVAYQRAANARARSTGDRTDAFAMGRIMDAFDQHVADAARNGGFSGDAQELLGRLNAARASHAAYRREFSPQGPGDKTGRFMQDVLGRYEGQDMTPDKFAAQAFGSQAAPGGEMPLRVAQRIRASFGENSPEWAAYRQGLVSHLVDTPEGIAPYSPATVSDRLNKFFNGTSGRALSQVAFSPAERQQILNYATHVRALEPAPRLADALDRAMDRFAGSNGTQVINEIMGENGKGLGRNAAALVTRLRTELSREAFDGLRQGAFQRLVDAGEGKTPYGAQAMSQRLHGFLNSPLATALYSERERNVMRQLAQVYSKMTPVAGTTNPSGTAPMLMKMLNKSSSTLLGLLGFSHGGLPGAALMLGAGKAAGNIAERMSARDASRRFYGEQPRAPIPQFRMPRALVAASTPTLVNQ